MDYRATTQVASGYTGSVPLTQAVPTSSPENSQIRDGVCQSESLLSEIHEALSALEKRLDTVLTPVPPSTASANGNVKQGPPSSHLHGRIGILNEGFLHAVQRIHALHGRIEV